MSNDESFLRRWSRRKHESAETAVETGPVESTVPPNLPPVEDLGFESDFKDFMRPEVDRETRSAALKKLFMSPHYRASDGLDVYVGDYSSPDPLPAGMLAGLVQARELLADARADAPTEPGTPQSVDPKAKTATAQPMQTASGERQTSPADTDEESPGQS
ncbi:MAG: DUF3306 domain-containing protein [Betaproteobacteria bacterium]